MSLTTNRTMQTHSAETPTPCQHPTPTSPSDSRLLSSPALPFLQTCVASVYQRAVLSDRSGTSVTAYLRLHQNDFDNALLALHHVFLLPAASNDWLQLTAPVPPTEAGQSSTGGAVASSTAPTVSASSNWLQLAAPIIRAAPQAPIPAAIEAPAQVGHAFQNLLTKNIATLMSSGPAVGGRSLLPAARITNPTNDRAQSMTPATPASQRLQDVLNSTETEESEEIDSADQSTTSTTDNASHEQGPLPTATFANIADDCARSLEPAMQTGEALENVMASTASEETDLVDSSSQLDTISRQLEIQTLTSLPTNPKARPTTAQTSSDLSPTQTVKQSTQKRNSDSQDEHEKTPGGQESPEGAYPYFSQTREEFQERTGTQDEHESAQEDEAVTDDEYPNTSKSSRQFEGRTGYESVLSAAQQDENGSMQDDRVSSEGEDGILSESYDEYLERIEQPTARSVGQQDEHGQTQKDGPSTGGEQGSASAGQTSEDTNQEKAIWYETYMG